MRIEIASTLVEVVVSQFMVELRLDDGTSIQIEAELSLTTGSVKPVTDASLPDFVVHDSVARMVGVVVTELVICEASGSLTVKFAGGVEATVHADPEFEAWTLRRRDGSRWVSLPGGSVARWLPDTRGLFNDNKNVVTSADDAGEVRITVHQAFLAMADFVWEFGQRAGDDLLTLIGDISPLPDGSIMDPAAWDDWLASVERTRSGPPPHG